METIIEKYLIIIGGFMSIDEKVKNAKTTDWLSEGLSNNEIKRIKISVLLSAKIKLMFKKYFN